MTTAAPAVDSTRKRLQSVFGGSIGNLIEWYDWYTYSACAIYFAPAFFPKGDPTTQLLNTAAIFALGFLIRPLGGWVLGRYADRRGRKAALTLSVLLMCMGSLMIALAPGYSTIGVAAPATLLVARLVQGFSVGGEYGTSATYMSEIAPAGQRGFYSGILYVTLIMGQLLAQAVLLLLQFVFLTHEQLGAWGWRIPFLIGAAAAVGGLYLRRNLPETDTFQKHQASARPGGEVRLLMRHPREVLIVIGLTMGGTLYSLYSSISAVVKAELFPVEIRALGVGLPYAIAVSLFGGSAPSIALGFKSIGREDWFYWYVTACVLGSLLVYIFMREPQRTSRI